MGFGGMPVLNVEEGPLYLIEDLLLSSLKGQLQSGYLASRYVNTIQSRLLPKRRSAHNRRLFISRENAGRRRIQNQKDVEDCLKEYGFESIAMEKLSPQEQIDTMYDAEAVISPHGAGLTNLLFGRQLQVLEIFPSRHLAPHYFFLAKSLGHSYRFMCGEEQSLNPSSFVVNLEQLRANTEELLDHVPNVA
jgi:capsular polysaccharide biosynthesis protein